MANVMTKRGSLDNVVTYEHICDTTEDLQNIDPRYINLGTIAVVLQGQEGIEFYMANSNKEWITITTGGNGGGDEPGDDEEMVYEFEAIEFTYQEYSSTYTAPAFKSIEDATDIFANLKQGKHVVFHLPGIAGHGIYDQYLAVGGFSDLEGYEFLSLGANYDYGLATNDGYSEGHSSAGDFTSFRISDGKLVLVVYSD